MKFIQNFLPVFLAVSLFAIDGQTQEQIGVASAVNKNTTDLTLEQERKLIDAGYEIIQNHTIETDGIGRAQMLLLDGTAFSIGPNSSVVLDKRSTCGSGDLKKRLSRRCSGFYVEPTTCHRLVE